MIECLIVEKEKYEKLINSLNCGEDRSDFSNNKVRVFEVEISNDIDEYVYREVFIYDYNVDFEIVAKKCLKATMLKMINDEEYSYLLQPEVTLSCSTLTYTRDVCSDVKI